MSQNRLKLVWLGVLAAAAALFLAVALVGLGLLSAEGNKLIDLKQRTIIADAQLANLTAAKKQVEQFAYFNDVARTVLPNDKDQAQAVEDIVNLANLAGISIASVAFPTSNLGSKPVATNSDNDAATVSAQSAISQAKPVQDIAGLYSLELIISPQTGSALPDNRKVTFPKLLDFLSRIERNRRTAQITQVSIQPQNTDSGPSQFINFTITINIFMKP